MFCAFWLLPNSIEAQSQDSLKQHTTPPSQFARAGDRTHASTEYRYFIAEALHRIASGKADAGEFEYAEHLFDQALVFAPEDRGLQFDFAKACLDADKLPCANSPPTAM